MQACVAQLAFQTWAAKDANSELRATPYFNIVLKQEFDSKHANTKFRNLHFWKVLHSLQNGTSPEAFDDSPEAGDNLPNIPRLDALAMHITNAECGNNADVRISYIVAVRLLKVAWYTALKAKEGTAHSTAHFALTRQLSLCSLPPLFLLELRAKKPRAIAIMAYLIALDVMPQLNKIWLIEGEAGYAVKKIAAFKAIISDDWKWALDWPEHFAVSGGKNVGDLLDDCGVEDIVDATRGLGLLVLPHDDQLIP